MRTFVSWSWLFCADLDESGGITRHSPEGRWFQRFAAEHGFHEAVKWRDSGRPIPNGGGAIPTKEDLER